MKWNDNLIGWIWQYNLIKIKHIKPIRSRRRNGQNIEKMTVFSEKRSFFDWNPATCYPPGRYVPSTFTADELNFCVRNGNRWILVAIITGMAPLVGLEPTTLRLTAACSTDWAKAEYKSEDWQLHRVERKLYKKASCITLVKIVAFLVNSLFKDS